MERRLQLHIAYKRERGEEARGRRRGGTLLEINRNVTIFQRLFPYRVRLSPHFPPSLVPAPFRRTLRSFLPSPPLPSPSLSFYPSRRYARENRGKREQEGSYVCRVLEKTERGSDGSGGRYIPTRDETSTSPGRRWK